MKNLLLIFFAFGIFSCKSPVVSAIIYPSFVDTSKDNVWGADVRLSIVDMVKMDDGVLYTVKSKYKNDTLGFQVLLPNEEDKSGSGSGLEIRSLGKISRNFRNALATLYKSNIDTSKAFPDKLSLYFVDIDKFVLSTLGKKADDKNGFHDFKIFFEDAKESEDAEAELFLNINNSSKMIELREKDEEYRKGILVFFSNDEKM